MTNKAIVKLLTIDQDLLAEKKLSIRYGSPTFGSGQKIVDGFPVEEPVDLGGQSIDEFVQSLLRSDEMQGTPRTDSPFQGDKGLIPSQLDLALGEDAYIVFLLDPHWNWQFNRRGNCFTLSRSDDRAREMYYNDITHHRPDFSRADRFEEVGNYCRAIHLRHQFINKQYHDKFNLHVEFLSGPDDAYGRATPSRATGIIIDPDVNNCPACPPG